MIDPLNLQQAIVLNVQLLQLIVKQVQKARYFKPKCIELGNTASFLLAVLQENSSALTTVESAMQLHNCLNNLLSFVLQCVREYNFLQKARELYVQRKLPDIQRDLDKWFRICLLEVVIKSRSDLLLMEASSWASFEKVKEGQADMSSKIDESMKLQIVNYQSLRKLVEDEKMGCENVGGLEITFREQDSRLQVGLDDDGHLSGTLDGFGAVICVEVNEDEMKPGRKGPRHAEIYQHISDGTLVQAFHGFTVQQGELGGQKHKIYAVMEDMRSYPTLADMLINQSLPECLDCLRTLYELANTIAYFHSLEMILKIINDESVVLKRIMDADGLHFQPCLTNVVQARRFQEASLAIELDTRFEAPERKRQGVHTLRTDIWSLGIIILECVTRSFPYSSSPFQKTGAKTREEIRQLLSQGTSPFPSDSLTQSSSHSPHVKRLVAIAKECCSRNPKLRPPSAAIVAESILDICNLQVLQAPLVIEEDLERVKASVLEAVSAKRRDSESRYEVSESDAAVLRRSAENSMDPVSHFLFGAAIWYGVVLPSDEHADEIVIGPVAVSNMKLAQESLLYLESAFDSGNRDAAHECAEVHKFLGKRYRDVSGRLKSGSAL